jgi:hypothetical protein
VAERDYKFEVEVVKLDKALKINAELLKDLKQARLSRKMIAEMRREAVECPILGKQVPFLQCYNCRNFVRRVRGRVYCRGNPL